MNLTIFYVIAGAVFLCSLGVRYKVKVTHSEWSQVKSATGMVGGQVARIILDANDLRRVSVEPTHGKLTDRYDPRRDRVLLSKENFLGKSVAGVAVAAHECGHALQDATGYGPLRLQTALIPLADAGARLGLPLLMVGAVFGFSRMVQIGALSYAASILLHLVTLPVEFNASRRALEELDGLGLVSPDGREGAREVLRVASMTYLAGVASSAWCLTRPIVIGYRKLLGEQEPPLPKPM